MGVSPHLKQLHHSKMSDVRATLPLTGDTPSLLPRGPGSCGSQGRHIREGRAISSNTPTPAVAKLSYTGVKWYRCLAVTLCPCGVTDLCAPCHLLANLNPVCDAICHSPLFPLPLPVVPELRFSFPRALPTPGEALDATQGLWLASFAGPACVADFANDRESYVQPQLHPTLPRPHPSPFPKPSDSKQDFSFAVSVMTKYLHFK